MGLFDRNKDGTLKRAPGAVRTEGWRLGPEQLRKVMRGERVALPDNHPLNPDKYEPPKKKR